MGFHHTTVPFDGEFFDHYYLCHYRPRARGYDGLSESLLHFKSGWRFHRQAWVECFLAELKKVPVQKGTLVIRALGSDEQSVIIDSRNSLDALGLAIEDGFQCLYGPWLLRKKRVTQKVKYLSPVERESECMGVYFFSPPDVLVNEIIIIDDILTTGTTMKAIIQAIRTVLTDVDIKLFTLASTDQRAILNKTVMLRSASYRWVSHKGWTTASEDAAEYQSALRLLKEKILNDAFYEDDEEWGMSS